jgi:murein L,D-transpeptidase YcbB/YkuD
MKSRHRTSFLLLVVVVLLPNCGSPRRGTKYTEALKTTLQSKPLPNFVDRGRKGIRLWNRVRDFYQHRDFQPAWIRRNWLGKHKLHPEGEVLLQALGKCGEQGLNPEDFNGGQLSAEWQKILKNRAGQSSSVVEITKLDLWFTYSFMKLGSQMLWGRVDPTKIDPQWMATLRKADWNALLEQALKDRRLEQTLQQLAPQHPEFAGLQRVLQRYRGVAASGGWVALPTGIRIHKGDCSANTAALKRNLQISGDLSPVKAEAQSSVFDDATEEAVKNFEARHGLQVDGIVDPEMLALWRIPVDWRVRQIEMNMDRWRWLPNELGEIHIRVNIPDYQLQMREATKTVLRMRVVVGADDNRTPVFSDKMTYIVFNPYWHIPKSIMTKETLPAILKDKNYLSRNNIEVVESKDSRGKPLDPESVDWSHLGERDEYVLRQKPGAGNSLGLVKFMFPNPFNVYLHDTPSGSLFERIERNLSHGCIRLERPLELAEYIFRDHPERAAERIKTAMTSGDEQAVPLKTPLPIHLMYMTAWVDAGGALQFRNDVYGYDQMQNNLTPTRASHTASRTGPELSVDRHSAYSSYCQ